jgi:hypothetical protein
VSKLKTFAVSPFRFGWLLAIRLGVRQLVLIPEPTIDRRWEETAVEAAIKDLIETLIENLRRQEGIYHSMRSLARQQLEAAADPAGAELDEDVVLKAKAQLVEDLQLLTARAMLLERDLAERYGMPEFTLKGMSGKVSDEIYQSLTEAFTKLGGVLKDIADLDAKTIQLMNSKLSAYRAHRRQPANTAQAVQAYRDGSRVKKD